jgi:hypothetical protein
MKVSIYVPWSIGDKAVLKKMKRVYAALLGAGFEMGDAINFKDSLDQTHSLRALTIEEEKIKMFVKKVSPEDVK